MISKCPTCGHVTDDSLARQLAIRHRLTPRQRVIVEILLAAVDRDEPTPTLQEMANEMGVTRTTVFEHVSTMIERGVLTNEPKRNRSIRLVLEKETSGS